MMVGFSFFDLTEMILRFSVLKNDFLINQFHEKFKYLMQVLRIGLKPTVAFIEEDTCWRFLLAHKRIFL